MSLIEKAALIGACMDDGIIDAVDAIDLVIEQSHGGLTRLDALRLLIEHGHDGTPHRDQNGRWTQP
ncbi:hypothetical protein ACFVH6_22275 [Spirillospora sp. NPDC127200]